MAEQFNSVLARTVDAWLSIFGDNRQLIGSTFPENAPINLRIADRIIADLWGYDYYPSRRYRKSDAITLANAIEAIERIGGIQDSDEAAVALAKRDVIGAARLIGGREPYSMNALQAIRRAINALIAAEQKLVDSRNS